MLEALCWQELNPWLVVLSILLLGADTVLCDVLLSKRLYPALSCSVRQQGGVHFSHGVQRLRVLGASRCLCHLLCPLGVHRSDGKVKRRLNVSVCWVVYLRYLFANWERVALRLGSVRRYLSPQAQINSWLLGIMVINISGWVFKRPASRGTIPSLVYSGGETGENLDVPGRGRG